MKQFVNQETYAKYKKFKIAQLKSNNPNKNYINCPTPDCEEIMEFEQLDPDDCFVECSYNHKFCARCKSIGWHKKGKCKNVYNFICKFIVWKFIITRNTKRK